MEVLAVSTALPAWHDVNGKKTFTSIVREPLDTGVIQVCAAGIEGNDTAVHDGPVYAFFAHHYDYWCGRLGVNREQWDWCHWGENITFKCESTDITEETFHLGDIWHVGENVRLQVCGARVPCFKLSWRCGQKDSWLKALAESGRCGVYFRVLQSGNIRKGDRAYLVHKQTKNTIDCASITKAAFGGSSGTIDTINLLANHELLVGMQRMVFGRKLTMLEDKMREGKNAWTGWRRFRPSDIIDEAPGIKSFYLEAEDGGPLATYDPGQFLTIRLPDGDVRSWSLSDWPRDANNPAYYRVTIKRSQKASVWMLDHCTKETILEVRSPKGSFVLDWKQFFPPRQVYMSAGVGITPIFAMMRAHAMHMKYQKQAIWIHVSRNGDDVPFQNEVAHLLPTMKIVRCYTSPKEQDDQGKDYDIKGRPDIQALRGLLSTDYRMSITTGNKTFPLEGKQSAFYICGPPAFETSMRASLSELGISESAIRSEKFVGGATTEIAEIESAVVNFSASHVVAKWSKEKPLSILELAEQVGLTPDYGCRVGACGSCSSKIICGTTTGGLQPDGNVLICMARPSAPKIEIEI